LNIAEKAIDSDFEPLTHDNLTGHENLKFLESVGQFWVGYDGG
jgi:hypothetical protein